MIKFTTCIFCISLAFYLVSCSSDGVDPVLSNSIESKTFTLNTPSGWKLEEGQGYDTYVGTIFSSIIPGDTIHFDQGFFSHPGVEYIAEGELSVYYERLLINEIPSVIKKFKDDRNGAEIISLGVYIGGEEDQKIRFYVIDVKNDQLAIEICKTLRFL